MEPSLMPEIDLDPRADEEALVHQRRAERPREIVAQEAYCYSCPGQVEEGLARLGSPQCQDCRDERRPISPGRFLALCHDFVDGIDMAAIVRQRRNAGTVEAMLDGMSWAA